MEPPVYVSDRRLVKALALMQVAAYCNGRSSVTEYDALLLEHVLWAAPETAPKIADWLLAQLAADDGMRQVDYLLSGIFSRACKALGGASERADEIAAEAAQLRGLLSEKLLTVLVNLEGERGLLSLKGGWKSWGRRGGEGEDGREREEGGGRALFDGAHTARRPPTPTPTTDTDSINNNNNKTKQPQNQQAASPRSATTSGSAAARARPSPPRWSPSSTKPRTPWSACCSRSRRSRSR